MEADVIIVGGGLAGSEAAWQVARRGLRARLHEMRPAASTAAHRSDRLGELVCSNSFKSDLPGTAPHLLKQELRDRLAQSYADVVIVPLRLRDATYYRVQLGTFSDRAAAEEQARHIVRAGYPVVIMEK